VFGRYIATSVRVSPEFESDTLIQNTEDEVLKAAIAKYGKNQW
jgi:hypothetical protein